MTQMYEVMDYKDKNIYSLDEMIDMYDNDKLNYSFVSKRICCPCCELKITDIKIDDESASIRSKRSEHKPDCDYYGLKISQNDIKKMIKNKEKFDFENKYPKKRLPQKSIERKLTEDDFDITKLKIRIEGEVGIDEYYFGDIVSGVYYDDEEVENYGGSTDGKSFDVTKNF